MTARRTAAVVIGCWTALLASTTVPARAPRRTSPASTGASLAWADVRYRASGQARMLLFWMGRDDVGGARLTVSRSAEGQVIALFAGSNPERAPHGLNQWIYLREESRPDAAEVFAFRSVSDAADAADPTSASLDSPRFHATCASVQDVQVRTATTTIANGPGLSYRTFDRVLDRLAAARHWSGRDTLRPAGAEVGFLTALERLLSAQRALGAAAAPSPLTYVYGGIVYDLALVRTTEIGAAVVGSVEFARLWRSEFKIRNRTTRRVTPFAATYAPDGPAPIVPVQLFYQPNWWLKVELRRDESVEAPADPSADAGTLDRIRRICGSGDAAPLDVGTE